jgi:hypothetical protein
MGGTMKKKCMAVRIIKHAMEIIHLLSDQNPIQVIVDAVVNRYGLLMAVETFEFDIVIIVFFNCCINNCWGLVC